MKNWIYRTLGNKVQTRDDLAEDLSFKSQASRPLIALQLAHQAQWGNRDFHGLSEAGYRSNAIAYRCVRLIAESAASVGFCVTRKGEVHAGDPLIGAFNQVQSGSSFTEILESFYGYLQVCGNGYLEAVKLDDQVIGFRALRPDRVEVKTNAKGYKTGYQYSVNNRNRFIKDDLATGRCGVYHLRLFHPTNDFYGYAPMEAAARAIDIHNEGARWSKALLDNSARPSGALVYQGSQGNERLSSDQFDRLKTELEQAHSGAERAGRPMLLEGGLDWKAMSLSPMDMDFLNARREAAREIALAFGVPPMLLGIPGDNTYSNYREANLAFWRMVILPLVKKTAHGLERWMRPHFGQDVNITVDMDAIPALSDERTALWTRLSNASFLTDNERRQMADLPPLEPSRE